jgi:hypothetical protein
MSVVNIRGYMMSRECIYDSFKTLFSSTILRCVSTQTPIPLFFSLYLVLFSDRVSKACSILADHDIGGACSVSFFERLDTLPLDGGILYITKEIR